MSRKKLAGNDSENQDSVSQSSSLDSASDEGLDQKNFTYQQLNVWHKGVELYGRVKDVVEDVSGSAQDELAIEIRRTALFLPCHIASGYEYRFLSRKTAAMMLRQVANHAVRLEVQLKVAQEIGMIETAEDLEMINSEILGIRKMVLSLAGKLMKAAYRKSDPRSED